MNQLRFLIFYILLSLCASDAFSTGSDIFIIFQAGFNGCSKDSQEDPRGADVYKPLKRSLKLLEKSGISYDYSVACFPFELQPKTLKYYLDKSQSVLLESSISGYRSMLKTSVKTSKAKNILIVGHSHGAWLAMKQVLEEDFPVQKISFISIDPISLKDCTFGVFFRNLIRNKIPFLAKNDSCLRAPKDISEAEYVKLQGRLFHWSNFYQENYMHLHSSELVYADENYNLDINEENYENNPHADVTTHKSIKSSFYLRAMEIVFE